MRFTLPLLLLISTAPACLAADHYSVRYKPDSQTVEVEACFDGETPREIYRSSDAHEFSTQPRSRGQELATRGTGSTLYLPQLPNDSCIAWQTRLGQAAASGDYRMAMQAGETVLADTGLWFWKGPWRRDITVEVTTPDGYSISVPWPASLEGGKRIFTPSKTPSSWSSRTVFGRFETREIVVSGATIHLALAGSLSPEVQDMLANWVEASVNSVVPVFGHFPTPQIQVIVVPIGRRGEPVPWAHVLRGGGAAVEFFVDETRSRDEFHHDWTSTHEFSHLLLPYVASNDRWLSEGLASYYQSVLRARDGRLSDMQAWQKLHDGFKRGENGTREGTLAEVTRAGNGSIMRVYWSGAAMMLEADTRLRELSGGEQTLDSVLSELNDCCRQSGKRWRARDLLAELDRISGTSVFSRLYRENVHAETFPDVSDVYRDLGLETRFGRIRPVNDAPLATIRDGIMAPGQG